MVADVGSRLAVRGKAMVGLDSRARASCCAACTLFNRKHQDPSPGPGPRARGEGVAGYGQAGRQAGKGGGEDEVEEEGSRSSSQSRERVALLAEPWQVWFRARGK
mgnify:CR=1 FL=1